MILYYSRTVEQYCSANSSIKRILPVNLYIFSSDLNFSKLRKKYKNFSGGFIGLDAAVFAAAAVVVFFFWPQLGVCSGVGSQKLVKSELDL